MVELILVLIFLALALVLHMQLRVYRLLRGSTDALAKLIRGPIDPPSP